MISNSLTHSHTHACTHTHNGILASTTDFEHDYENLLWGRRLDHEFSFGECDWSTYGKTLVPDIRYELSSVRMHFRTSIHLSNFSYNAQAKRRWPQEQQLISLCIGRNWQNERLTEEEGGFYIPHLQMIIHFISWSIPSNSSKCSIVAIVQCMRNYSTGNETRKLLGNEVRNLLGNKTRKLSFLILHLQTSTVICIQNATVNVRLLTYL